MLERLEWNAYIAKEYLIFKQLGITGIDDLVEYDYNTEE
jgi:L-fuculose-phosphate aldolase